MLIKLSAIVVIVCITTIRADVSHILARETAVDQQTIDILRKNISNHLVHLENDGNSQPMKLKHIYSATKQSVTSTVYTVQALLDTSEGSQRCEIRVLEQPLFDFCQIRVKCENGGTYEVSLNQHGTHSHPFGLPDYVAPQNVPEPKQEAKPASVFTVKPPRPIYNVPQPDEPKPYGIPKPAETSAPEIQLLPYDQLPKEPKAYQAYLHNVFDEFMVKFKRAYIDVPGEREYRFGVFAENYEAMNEFAANDRTAKYSVTEFSDLDETEYGRIMGFDPNLLKDLKIPEEDTNKTVSTAINGTIPEHYDEREQKYVTRVKLQGDCAACWAFTTVAVVEGLCARRTKKLQEFSEQSLIDCDTTNFGCKGGAEPNAIKHIIKRGGLELATTYPFVFAQTKCHFDEKTVRVKLANLVGFKKRDEEAMKRWLFQRGPIAASINANTLKYYKKGVINPTEKLCSSKKINHAITIVGYGVEVTEEGEKLPYWICKNHWNTGFGEKGFFRIARGKNACGIALWAYSIKLADIPNNCLLPDGK